MFRVLQAFVHAIMYIGPEHLRGFATDENVVATFREAVLSYRDMPRGNVHTATITVCIMYCIAP